VRSEAAACGISFETDGTPLDTPTSACRVFDVPGGQEHEDPSSVVQSN
jgi:hypothetical protein